MPKTDVDHFKRKLLLLKRELQQADEDFKDGANTVELDQARTGRLTRMDALQSQQMALESSRRRSHRLVAIDGALRRIEQGEFGSCFVCDEALSEDRLTIDPTITRCMTCVDA